MAGWEMKIITAEAHRLIASAAEDADLRSDLRALAQEILAATEAPQSRTDGAPVGAGEKPGSSTRTHDGSQIDRPEAPEPLRELTLGRRTPFPFQAPAPGVPTRPVHDEDELNRIEARCRAKAEAARQRRNREGKDFPIENTLIEPEFAEWADRLMDCLYWKEGSDASPLADPLSLDDVAGCFEATAEALSLVQRIWDDHRDDKGLERALPLIAQAQSALRAAFQRLQAPDDPDPLLRSTDWVRETAARHRIYLKRHMRADDQADPNRWSDLLALIDRVDAPARAAGGDNTRTNC